MTQILANSIVYASEIAIIAVGVALSYSILRFANFAHVQFAVVGGYLTYTFAVLAGLPGSAEWAIGLLVGINLLFGGATLIGMALAARNT